MKTPIEKASAVRSGGSSMASRRRNVARNIKSFEFRVQSFELEQTNPKLETRNSELLFEAIQSLSFVVVGVEHGQEFGDYKEILDLIGKIQ